MKFLRPILWGVAVLAALLMLAAILAFNASVQTWAARHVLAGRQDMKAGIGRVSAGFKVIEVSDFQLQKPGISLSLPSLTIEMPLTAAASKNIAVKKLVAKGWKVDLWVPTTQELAAASSPAPSPAKPGATSVSTPAAQPFVFDGLLKLVVLPVDFSLEEIDVAGDVSLRAVAGLPNAHAQVRLTGGKLKTGGEGRFTSVTLLTIDDPASPVKTVEITSLIVAQMDTPRTFQKVSVATDIKAIGPKFPQGANLHSDLVLSGGAQGETYLVTIQTPIDTGWKSLFNLDAAYAPVAATFSGKWRIDATNADVAPFLLGLKLPAFSATGDGTFETDRAFGTIHASGRFDSTVDQLSVLMPELAALGRIRTQVDFDLSKQGDVFRVDRFSAGLSGAKPIASVQALQKFEYDLGARALKVTDATTELLRLSLHGLPLSWVQPFLKNLSLSGDDVRGEFFVSARNDGFAVRPAAPITLDNLSLSQGGRPLLRDVDVEIRMSADATQQGWQANVTDFSIRSGLATLVTADLKAGQPADGSGAKQPIKATGHFEASLPAILAQPVAAAYASLLNGGVVKGDVTADLDGTKRFSVTLDATNLTSEKADKLPHLQLSARVDLSPDGRVDAQIPVVLDAAGRKSDLELTAHVTTSPALRVEADVLSDHIFVQDLQPLQALAAALPEEQKPDETANGPAKQAPKSAGPAVADKAPFWSGFTGQLKLALKEIVYSPDVKIANVGGELKIGAQAIDLQNFKAALGPGADAALNGKMTFDGKAAEPYVFSGEAKVTGFDPAPFFRAANPQREPTVEGKFDVTGKLGGSALNAALLTGKIKADLTLTSRGGVFRGLALPKGFSDRFQGKSGGLLSNLSGVVGALGGSKAGSAAAAAAEIVPMFSEIPFDQLNLQLSHDHGAGMTKIQNFALISPTLRLTGSGSLLQQDGVPLLKQPLTAQIELGAHGHVADVLGKQGMLQGGADSLGYAPLFSPIKIDGTLSDMGTEALTNLLVQKLLSSSAAGPLGNLFGK